MPYNLNNLRYIIIPGKFPLDRDARLLHNKAFLFWKDFWNNVFMKNGAQITVNPDDFWRQDMVTLLMNGDDVIGAHLYSFFHIESEAALHHSYFTRIYTQEYFMKLKSRNAKTLMSMEYLTVDPRWRKNTFGISLGAVLLGLARKQQRHYGVDVLMGPTRTDNGTNKLVAESGGEALVSGLNMYNTPIDLMAIFSDKSAIHPNFNVMRLIQTYWNSRTDLTRLPLQIPGDISKKAA